MRKIIFAIALVVVVSIFSACEQEDIRSADEYELIDPQLTEGDGDEDNTGDRPSSSN